MSLNDFHHKNKDYWDPVNQQLLQHHDFKTVPIWTSGDYKVEGYEFRYDEEFKKHEMIIKKTGLGAIIYGLRWYPQKNPEDIMIAFKKVTQAGRGRNSGKSVVRMVSFDNLGDVVYVGQEYSGVRSLSHKISLVFQEKE